MANRVDAVIVGSGAAGSLMAARLAEAGKRVLILEAGPARGAQDLVSNGLWGRRLKWGGAPVIETGTQPVGHNFNTGWGTGGAAVHHYGVWPRLHPEDFNEASTPTPTCSPGTTRSSRRWVSRVTTRRKCGALPVRPIRRHPFPYSPTAR